jgi:hypothetical protein
VAANLEHAEVEEPWPIEERDPERVAWMRAAGIRPATRSLDRPRHVARKRPGWLAFLLRSCAAAERLLTSIGKPGGNSRVRADPEECELAEIWPMPERDPEVTERLRAAGVRLATRSLDRPRRVARRRPAWLVFLLTLVGARG